ncbi:hypothetical protein RND81_O112000 [Saponaria officinalis]|uniref:ATP-dependent Clp protease proteolytic subunit n=1 Tax=Saponaria officinalis TaxID=3572 RepID=A0AAW1GDF7_SAPOF
MPIGVPKVPFRSPGEEDASWVDRERQLNAFLSFRGIQINISNSNNLWLARIPKNLFINSPGGWVIPGVAIYDTMQFVRPDVHTICMGLAASMGSFILVGGEITKHEINIKQRSHRSIFKLLRKEGWVMIHQPASSFYEAQTGEFILEAEELLKLRETLTRVYVQRTGKPVWIVSEDMERDVFMSATEAQTHGIVDLVAVE